MKQRPAPCTYFLITRMASIQMISIPEKASKGYLVIANVQNLHHVHCVCITCTVCQTASSPHQHHRLWGRTGTEGTKYIEHVQRPGLQRGNSPSSSWTPVAQSHLYSMLLQFAKLCHSEGLCSVAMTVQTNHGRSLQFVASGETAGALLKILPGPPPQREQQYNSKSCGNNTHCCSDKGLFWQRG